jgi:hypothetical protein
VTVRYVTNVMAAHVVDEDQESRVQPRLGYITVFLPMPPKRRVQRISKSRRVDVDRDEFDHSWIF